ncbi:hypothetical protein QBC33DRAFT_37227 [Phialemonium atrogriseum]|uniref:Uncharacterized protein n=1 Tax=Phialemonium atrogriseum TaxID=1093897 RepID=A0AAJ0CA59_9PEZI|nr:uncharacterized protein QBC33DRAFT_37227 [Phialemonium atrogriseum]KAK1772985.1 hypothetical protein QBC33DRAFT_37227 [Phialemonium atrogriseum]
MEPGMLLTAASKGVNYQKKKKRRDQRGKKGLYTFPVLKFYYKTPSIPLLTPIFSPGYHLMLPSSLYTRYPLLPPVSSSYHLTTFGSATVDCLRVTYSLLKLDAAKRPVRNGSSSISPAAYLASKLGTRQSSFSKDRKISRPTTWSLKQGKTLPEQTSLQLRLLSSRVVAEIGHKKLQQAISFAFGAAFAPAFYPTASSPTSYWRRCQLLRDTEPRTTSPQPSRPSGPSVLLAYLLAPRS